MRSELDLTEPGGEHEDIAPRTDTGTGKPPFYRRRVGGGEC